MIVHIQLDFESEEEAERILSAITPDNSPLPEGLEIECSLSNQKVNITIQSSRSLESLASTLEDIMSAIDLSLRTSDSID
jgi:tRNA threonylcarbamoyladenosine modification (KEOPS) complex  Pcc1 subunit